MADVIRHRSRASQVGPKAGITALSMSNLPRADSSPQSPKSQVFYAVVLHDFVAERADELEAKRGDPITVVAQSNREWFVAKPIGKLGRPGLIPVSFVEIHDPTTGQALPDVEGLMDRGDLPKVEDWKRAMMSYKQNSIPLGVIDAPTVTNSPYAPHNPRDSDFSNNQPLAAPEQPRAETPDSLPEGILLSADVVSFHFEMDEYWFRIDALFQPYARSGEKKLPPAKQLILFRVYNDFFDFQVALLDTFPREAGRQAQHPRMLPYMPGPAQDVDDALTAQRRLELDDYVHKLCDLSKAGARYILEHDVVRKFLAVKPGDVVHDKEPRTKDIQDLLRGDTSEEDDYDRRDDYANDVRHQMSKLKVNDERRSDGSEYEDEGYAPSPQRLAHDQDRHPYSQPYSNDRRPSNDSSYHQSSHLRNGSSTSFNRISSYNSHSRSNSPYPERNGESSSQSHWNDSTYQSNGATSTTRVSQAMSSRSRSHSIAGNHNNPPISAANPQTAFVKIKIFDQVADDLIAIRVHPRVTHAELMGKVLARLGGEVTNLRYRDSLTNTFVGLDTDEDLKEWMDGTDKHVLFAD